MFRRTAGWVLTFGFGLLVMWVVDWHPSVRKGLFSHGIAGLGVLLVGIAAVVVLVWAAVKHSTWKTVLAFVLGIASASWGATLFKGLFSAKLLLVLVALAALVLLWAWTVVRDREELRALRRRPAIKIRGRISAPHWYKDIRAGMIIRQAERQQADEGLDLIDPDADTGVILAQAAG